MNAPTSINRRSFLKQNCGAISSVGLLSSLVNLRMMNNVLAASGPPDDYRALVCIYLPGGLDGYNMLVPREADEFQKYSDLRSNIGTQADELIPIEDQTGRKFGLHEMMPNLASLYGQEDAAFIANIGTLVRPTTYADYNNGLALPQNLYSHRDQALEWQSSVPDDSGVGTGWGGRMADILNLQQSPEISMNISLSGQNLFQTGGEVFPYSIGVNGSAGLPGYNLGSSDPITAAHSRAVKSLLDRQYTNLYQRTIAQQTKNAQDAHEVFSVALVGAPDLSSETVARFNLPDGTRADRAREMQLIARTMAANEALGVKRQVFFISFGGWDDHDNVRDDLPPRLSNLDTLLGGFHAALEELGFLDKAITFTASEFGRNLVSNRNGSDHGWSGHQIVMGGPVSGGKIYGEYPEDLSQPFSQRVNSNIGLGTGGRFIPTTAVDEYAAELATWMGVCNNNELEAMLPNIRNFYASTATDNPIGFTV